MYTIGRASARAFTAEKRIVAVVSAEQRQSDGIPRATLNVVQSMCGWFCFGRGAGVPLPDGEQKPARARNDQRKGRRGRYTTETSLSASQIALSALDEKQ